MDNHSVQLSRLMASCNTTTFPKVFHPFPAEGKSALPILPLSCHVFALNKDGGIVGWLGSAASEKRWSGFLADTLVGYNNSKVI